MSNWIDCSLDVLATNPEEINAIAKALLVPPKEFLVGIIQRKKIDDSSFSVIANALDIAKELLVPSKEFSAQATETQPPADAEIEGLRELVAFKAVKNLGYVHESVNKARRFENSFKDRFRGYIDGHVCHVSETFPNAIFLAEYRDMQWSWSCKEVMRNGVVERSVRDDDQRAQAIDWMLLDIFAPFWAEYERGQPFGSMWNEWVNDLVAAADALREFLTRYPKICEADAQS